MSEPLLQIIIGSTRPGRVGPAIANWFTDRAGAAGGLNVELVDLLEVNLPLLDEPNHPRLGQYIHEHTKAWSNTVSRGDATLVERRRILSDPHGLRGVDTARRMH